MKLRQPRWTAAWPGLRPGSAMPTVVKRRRGRQHHGRQEQGSVAGPADQEDAERRAYRHGHVHAHAEVAHRLAAAGERSEVRGERARRGAEGRPADAVEDAHGHQQGHRMGRLVEQRAGGQDDRARQHDGLLGPAVREAPDPRSHDDGGEREAGEDDPRVRDGAADGDHVERQRRQQQVHAGEREEVRQDGEGEVAAEDAFARGGLHPARSVPLGVYAVSSSGGDRRPAAEAVAGGAAGPRVQESRRDCRFLQGADAGARRRGCERRNGVRSMTNRLVSPAPG